MKTEKDLQNACIKLVRLNGGYARKMEATNHRGFPDCLFITAGGRLMFVEFKTPKGVGKLSGNQVSEIALLRKHGAEVYVIDDYAAFCAIYEGAAND